MRILFFILVFIGFISCRKDKCVSLYTEVYTQDTVYPHPYYPAYPGSYWVYNDTHTVSVEPEWKSFPLKQKYNYSGCMDLVKTYVFLPQIDDKYLNFDRLLYEYGNSRNSENILFDDDDTAWYSWQNPESKFNTEKYYTGMVYQYERKNINMSDTITVNNIFYDSVWTIEENHRVSGGAAYAVLTETYLYSYVKNIGPVKIEKHYKDTNLSNYDYVLTLTDYWINK